MDIRSFIIWGIFRHPKTEWLHETWMMDFSRGVVFLPPASTLIHWQHNNFHHPDFWIDNSVRAFTAFPQDAMLCFSFGSKLCTSHQIFVSDRFGGKINNILIGIFHLLFPKINLTTENPWKIVCCARYCRVKVWKFSLENAREWPVGFISPDREKCIQHQKYNEVNGVVFTFSELLKNFIIF